MNSNQLQSIVFLLAASGSVLGIMVGGMLGEPSIVAISVVGVGLNAILLAMSREEERNIGRKRRV